MVAEAAIETRTVTQHPADDPQFRAALAAVVADFAYLVLPVEPAGEDAGYANPRNTQDRRRDPPRRDDRLPGRRPATRSGMDGPARGQRR